MISSNGGANMETTLNTVLFTLGIDYSVIFVKSLVMKLSTASQTRTPKCVNSPKRLPINQGFV